MDDRDAVRQTALVNAGFQVARVDAVMRLIGEASSRAMNAHQARPPSLLWMQAVGVGTPRGTKRDKQAMRIVARLARAQIDTAGHFLLDGDSNNLFWDQQEIAELMRAPRLHNTKQRWCN